MSESATNQNEPPTSINGQPTAAATQEQTTSVAPVSKPKKLPSAEEEEEEEEEEGDQVVIVRPSQQKGGGLRFIPQEGQLKQGGPAQFQVTGSSRMEHQQSSRRQVQMRSAVASGHSEIVHGQRVTTTEDATQKRQNGGLHQQAAQQHLLEPAPADASPEPATGATNEPSFTSAQQQVSEQQHQQQYQQKMTTVQSGNNTETATAPQQTADETNERGEQQHHHHQQQQLKIATAPGPGPAEQHHTLSTTGQQSYSSIQQHQQTLVTSHKQFVLQPAQQPEKPQPPQPSPPQGQFQRLQLHEAPATTQTTQQQISPEQIHQGQYWPQSTQQVQQSTQSPSYPSQFTTQQQFTQHHSYSSQKNTQQQQHFQSQQVMQRQPQQGTQQQHFQPQITLQLQPPQGVQQQQPQVTLQHQPPPGQQTQHHFQQQQSTKQSTQQNFQPQQGTQQHNNYSYQQRRSEHVTTTSAQSRSHVTGHHQGQPVQASPDAPKSPQQPVRQVVLSPAAESATPPSTQQRVATAPGSATMSQTVTQPQPRGTTYQQQQQFQETYNLTTKIAGDEEWIKEEKATSAYVKGTPWGGKPMIGGRQRQWPPPEREKVYVPYKSPVLETPPPPPRAHHHQNQPFYHPQQQQPSAGPQPVMPYHQQGLYDGEYENQSIAVAAPGQQQQYDLHQQAPVEQQPQPANYQSTPQQLQPSPQQLQLQQPDQYDYFSSQHPPYGLQFQTVSPQGWTTTIYEQVPGGRTAVVQEQQFQDHGVDQASGRPFTRDVQAQRTFTSTGPVVTRSWGAPEQRM